MSEHTKKKSASLESIIEDEWDILLDLKNTLKNPELSVEQKVHAANAYAYHASVLSKLLAQRGIDAHLDETTLGDFIKSVQPRTAGRRPRGIVQWMKRHSRRK
jgi:hypothetical protein